MARKTKTAPDTLETELYARGIWPIAGIDEAGRGPLAGPVVACAVILPPGLVIEGVYDSKKINPAKRAELAERIKACALAYAFGVVEPAEIDRINILQAAMKAMGEAFYAAQSFLGKPLRYILVDGNRLPKLPCDGKAVVKGDNRCHVIAAASILAKEARDTIMRDLHRVYPEYGFADHKGYPTFAHMEALAKYGPCREHRKTFKGV
jgi:ribonuclease HII